MNNEQHNNTMDTMGQVDPNNQQFVQNPQMSPQQPPVNPPQRPFNPLMQRIQLPGETFALPSSGVFYKSDELSPEVTNAEVHVHPMTAIDEICMKTPDLLFSGQAVKQVFARCIPQITNVDKLLSKDVDFLLLCLRKVSYGDQMQIDYKHTCKDAKKHTYAININTFINQAKKIDPTTITSKFTVEMSNNQIVMLRPITFGGYIEMLQTTNNDDDADPEKTRDKLIKSLLSIIAKVDETEDPEMIAEWLTSIPPQFIRAINNKIDDTIDWGPEFKANITCQDCNENVNVETPLNPLNFFT